MKMILICALATILLCMTYPNTLIAEDEVDPVRVMSIELKVDYYAQKYGVPVSLAHYIVKNESHYNPDKIGDMNITCKRTGKPVRARGLMQITECYHPNVTDKQAFDPDFNLDYGMRLAANKQTCIQQFSTCRNYYGK